MSELRTAVAAAWMAMAPSGLGCASSGAPEPAEEAPVVSAAPAPSVLEVSLADVGLDGAALDRSVNPCDDFYAFACGGWLQATEIPSDRSRWVRSFSVIHDRNERDLRAIVEAAAESEAGSPVEAKIGAWFGACMDEARADDEGLGPLASLLEAADEAAVKTLAPVLARLHRARVWAFFDLSALQDFKEATRVIGNLDQNGLGLPDRDYYLAEDEAKASIRAAYAEHVARLMVLGGRSERAAKVAAADVLRVETALAKVSKTRVERRDPGGMYNKLDLSGVQALAPRFDWEGYLEGLGRPDLVDISVTAPKFVEGMNALLRKMRPRVLRNYLRWHVLRVYAPTLTRALFEESFRLRKVLTGQQEPRPRWKRCVASTDEALGELLAQAFVEKRFAGDSKSAAEAYVRGISDAFAKNLAALDWMDEETKVRAREKLSKFSYLIGYPEVWKDYEFDVTAVFGTNALRAAEHETARDLARIGQPVDRGRWEMTPPTVNAYYHPLKNQMVFPAGILQPPFYAVDAHVPVNLGAMGMVVGHELTHGFDDQGSQFDGNGDLEMWWTKASRDAFEDKTACVVDQYAAYAPLPGVHLNGKLTLGENIADLGGLKLAFEAYREMRKDAPEVLVADGFDEDQQFFLANAQVWCAKAQAEEIRRRAQTDPHADPRSRVNGPMSNLSSFGDAFSCPAGAPMRPEKVCAVW